MVPFRIIFSYGWLGGQPVKLRDSRKAIPKIS